MGNKRAITRENLVKLRKTLKKHLPEHKSIHYITEKLIDYPTLSHLEHPNWFGYGRVFSEVLSEGHGAFGESENTYSYHTTDVNGNTHYVSDDTLILISDNDKILGTITLGLYDIEKEISKIFEQNLEKEKNEVLDLIEK
jgi:hypothetical protein